ncbi:MAG: M20/M25/M40 family metallo-hydrolase [Planctomycetota bacterium]|jgi:endoglucanase
MSESQKAWARSMDEDQFAFLRELLAAPSPIGMEGAMTHGILEPRLRSLLPDSWGLHRFRGNAGLIADSHPGDDSRFKVMVIGHADQIRMQVRSIGADGKIWVNSESFLPMTLIGHEVRLFSEDPENAGAYRVIEGGTIEAIGAIHFASPDIRAGRKGIKPTQLFLELQIHGKDRKKQVERLGIRAGDPILLKRPIRRGFSPDTYYGAYLDNGLGCFVAAEAARLLAESGGPSNVRYLAAFASHEEIGRMGSRVMAGEFAPDAVIAVDVAHDFEAAPGIGDRRMEQVKMGGGCSISFGSVCSAQLNSLLMEAAREGEIPMQPKSVGRDTGTDAMAAVFAAVDAAVTSIGVPIRNMHTISETGHTGDLIAASHLVAAAVKKMDGWNDGKGMTSDDLRQGHPRLDSAESLGWQEPPAKSDD